MKEKVFYLSSTILFWCFLVTIFSYSISYNLNVLNDKISRVNSLLTPQGWGFFTKDIREDYMYNLFDEKGNMILTTNTDMSNFFGASKKARKISMEVAIISSQIPDAAWVEVDEDSEPLSIMEVNNKYLYYLVEGKYKITRHKLVPYTWRNLNNAERKEIVYVQTVTK